MRRSLTAALAALTLASSLTTPAFADRYRHGGHNRHHHGDNNAAAAAVVAGLIGLAIGAAVVADSRREVRYEPTRIDPPPLPPLASATPDAQGWYGPFAEPSSEGCFMQRWVFDRELGRTFPERRPVDCLEAS